MANFTAGLWVRDVKACGPCSREALSCSAGILPAVRASVPLLPCRWHSHPGRACSGARCPRASGRDAHATIPARAFYPYPVRNDERKTLRENPEFTSCVAYPPTF